MREKSNRLPVGLRSCACLLAISLAMGAGSAFAQQASTPVDAETVKALIQRVQDLETQVQTLKSQVNSLTAASQNTPSVSSSSVAAANDTVLVKTMEQAGASMPTHGIEGLNTPRLQLRGFGDVGWNTSDLKGSTNSFALGQFNLFITSRLSDKASFLAETVIEADPASNLFGIDLERLMLMYSVSDRLNFAIGRYHTGIGFYNNAYHHSALMQTAIGRPFIFDFEDHGGILPIHNVGVSATGVLSNTLGLHYIAEIGNGRSARTELGNNPVQNVTDEHNGKAFNLALFFKPDALPGWQFGASGYHDHQTPLAAPNVSENILSGHVIYQRSRFEFLNEGVLLQHSPDHSAITVNIPGFYSQISRRFGNYRPYFRYEYLNVPARDPLYADVGLRHGPILGLRYDVNEMSAFKIQYGRTMHRNLNSVNALALQFAFAF